MNAKRVLVAYGSKAGATAGIAEEIARTLRDDAFHATGRCGMSHQELPGSGAPRRRKDPSGVPRGLGTRVGAGGTPVVRPTPPRQRRRGDED
ncbi:hypothetical protein ACFU5Y_01490 [Streptomyces gardneri]|uniref:hypothetical protein n=1 Tax=Streptomyces gardneri TaxID=66892 RepID=UPI0036BC3349